MPEVKTPNPLPIPIYFCSIYITDLSGKIGIEIEIPRNAQRNINKWNSVDDYYKETIFVPFVKDLLSEFDSRFHTHQLTTLKLSALIPAFIG